MPSVQGSVSSHLTATTSKASSNTTPPLSPEQVVAALAQVSFPRQHAGEYFWLKHDPERNPLTQLYCHIQGQSLLALPESYGVRSKVHEYGGLPYGLSEARIVWVDEQSQQLFCANRLTRASADTTRNLNGNGVNSPIDLNSLSVLTDSPNSRFGEPIFHPTQNWVVAIEEQHPEIKAQPIINRLVAIELTTGKQQVIACGADFYTSPCFNADGSELAWIEWQHPHQPWTETQLCKAPWQTGTILTKQPIFPTQHQQAASVQQPCFNAQGELLFISDHEGYWNLYLQRLDGQLQRLYSVEADCASAPWQFGNQHFQLLEQKADKLQLLICVTRGGQWQLERVTLTRDKQGNLLDQQVSRLTFPAHSFSFFAQISSLKRPDQPSKHSLLALVASEQYALSILTFDLDTQSADTSSAQFLAQGVYCSNAVKPETISLNLKAHQVEGLFYPNPMLPQAPLMINVHGGPTSAAFPGLQANIQFWCQQGFSVLDLNHRGSTGFGRLYRQALKGQWGEVDLEDARLMVHWLTKSGRILPDKVVIRGQSAGGYSALRAATLGYFQAAVSLYGISDLQRLATSTHKFESYYLNWLIGDPKEDAMLYQLRSPLYSLNQQAKLPDLLLFQGAEDPVVPLDQVTLFAQHYRALGHNCETVVYDNEGHGFRAFDNRLHQLKTEYAFYLAKGILSHGCH
ncbi:Dipeptidyl aminopeptidase/acylaminoacyl peptidase [Oceanospirillum multiglobuliferum]|uniref:Peptidase S9 prolyl oligopeptidase catalytic domain-containing protein n=1 Tax=Oceanospirillum multiglobuliferum TaxID=64969 RepID=A0A1T4S5C4_9GAMM|nr:prolyl oligopeptidase family serine peptidase [Oceanospirillum multiglobuliferum]OPX54458.1 hypothetical protein BTE48_14170 [Oceanospirillum multiglobuliferum]SKA23425.1 Dipeptidyl aminopeptidase/acylaminoacyl peptidase [Oceanospirillum multiglobuliferum]